MLMKRCCKWRRSASPKTSSNSSLCLALTCRIKQSCLMKALPHSAQDWGGSLLCVFKWACKDDFAANALLHLSHLNARNKKKNMTNNFSSSKLSKFQNVIYKFNLCKIVRLTPVWRLVCLTRSSFRVNVLSQTLHLKGVAPSWTNFLCTVRRALRLKAFPQMSQ